MTREEKRTELLTIGNHLAMVTEDLIAYRNMLEETGNRREAKLLDTITGKLYNLQWIIIEKAKG